MARGHASVHGARAGRSVLGRNLAAHGCLGPWRRFILFAVRKAPSWRLGCRRSADQSYVGDASGFPLGGHFKCATKRFRNLTAMPNEVAIESLSLGFSTRHGACRRGCHLESSACNCIGCSHQPCPVPSPPKRDRRSQNQLLRKALPKGHEQFERASEANLPREQRPQHVSFLSHKADPCLRVSRNLQIGLADMTVEHAELPLLNDDRCLPRLAAGEGEMKSRV